jgi:hypothetical protein
VFSSFWIVPVGASFLALDADIDLIREPASIPPSSEGR